MGSTAQASSNKTCDLSPIGSPANYWSSVETNLNSLNANDKVILLKAGNGNYYFVGAPTGVSLSAVQLDPWSHFLQITGGSAQVLAGNGLSGSPLFSATGNSFFIDKICGYTTNVSVDSGWTATTHFPYSTSPSNITTARFYNSEGQIPPEMPMAFLFDFAPYIQTFISLITDNLSSILLILALFIGITLIFKLFRRSVSDQPSDLWGDEYRKRRGDYGMSDSDIRKEYRSKGWL